MWPTALPVQPLHFPCVPRDRPGADACIHRKNNIQWECDNGGQLWTASAQAGDGGSTSFPQSFCVTGFSNLYSIFVGTLVVDLVFQVRSSSSLARGYLFAGVALLFYRSSPTSDGKELTVPRPSLADVHVLHGLAVPEEARALLGHEGSVLWR